MASIDKTGTRDDAVMRIVEAAVEAQTRMMLAYMEQMREQVKREIEKKIRAEFSGEQAYIGKGNSDKIAARNEAIVSDHRAGMSLRAIGRKHHMSHSNVRLVLGVCSSSLRNDTVDPACCERANGFDSGTGGR